MIARMRAESTGQAVFLRVKAIPFALAVAGEVQKAAIFSTAHFRGRVRVGRSSIVSFWQANC
jgi:hypothetical protein